MSDPKILIRSAYVLPWYAALNGGIKQVYDAESLTIQAFLLRVSK